MERRAQGTLEYLMLLAGVMFIVVLAIILIRTGVLDKAIEMLRGNTGTYLNLTNTSNLTPAG